MDRFGFIFRPHDLVFYSEGFDEPGIKNKRPSLVANTMKWLPPFKRSVATGIKSIHTGECIEGDMILLNLLPEQLFQLDSDFVLSKLLEAGKLAEKLGDKIVGLDAYTAFMINGGLDLSKKLNIPVTNGNSYTVASAPEVVLKALKLIKKQAAKSKIFIIGATTTIGKMCWAKLSKECGLVYLVAKDMQKIENINSDKCVSLDKSDKKLIKEAIQSSNLIVITSCSLARDVLDFKWVKKGTILYDACYPKYVPTSLDKNRKDILVVDGEAIRVPGKTDFHFSFGFPPGLAYGCMAETMMLTLEKKFENYSIGKKIDPQHVDEIAVLANKHGFSVGNLTRSGRVISEAALSKFNKLSKSSQGGLKIWGKNLVHY